ncbi:MAG: porphobilinogen synthase, partial [Proteobacteria bacterium]|nr:porphobilinogen synthase [Pseudomonadota bacterium]
MTSFGPARTFPATRLRRVRAADWRRRLIRETAVTADDLILPLFIIEGDNVTEPVTSLPGVSRLSIDRAVAVAREADREDQGALRQHQSDVGEE